MRILIISQYFWPETFLINDLALGLHGRGHEVTVLTGMPNYPGGKLYDGYGWFTPVVEDFQESRRTECQSCRAEIPAVCASRLNYLSFVVSASCLGPRRCRQEFDVILVFQTSPVTVGLPAMLLKRLRRIPILFWVLDLWPDSLSAAGAVKSTWVLKQVDRLVRWIYSACDRVLVQSPGFIPHVSDRGVAREQIHVFPSWAEASFQPLDLPEYAPERAELPDGFCLLFAGNIGVSQSFETILAAAELTRDCPDLHWVVMGDGRQKAWVSEQIASRDDLSTTVHLLPPRPSRAMPRCFAAADALLVSLKREDIFRLTIPGKVQSYLACGRPILAALDGEGATVIRDADAGLVCETENPVALASAARELYAADAFRLAEMGRNGRHYFEQHFEREMLFDRFESIMWDVTGSLQCAA